MMTNLRCSLENLFFMEYQRNEKNDWNELNEEEQQLYFAQAFSGIVNHKNPDNNIIRKQEKIKLGLTELDLMLLLDLLLYTCKEEKKKNAVMDLKRVRNNLCHSPGQLNVVDMFDSWKTVESALHDLGISNTDINDFRQNKVEFGMCFLQEGVSIQT